MDAENQWLASVHLLVTSCCASTVLPRHAILERTGAFQSGVTGYPRWLRRNSFVFTFDYLFLFF